MKRLKKLYARLPYFLQQQALNYVAKANFKKRFSPEFYRYLEEYIQSWNADLDELARLQEDNLKKMLLASFRYSPWYHKILEELNLGEKDILERPYEVLHQMPYLTKQDIKDNLETIVSRDTHLKGETKKFTSGSTGTPMRIIFSDDAIARSFALWKRYHHTIGLPLHPRSVRFSGNEIIPLSRKKPPFWQYNKYENQLFFSIYHMSWSNMPKFVEKLETFKPELLDGYTSSIQTFAKYIVNNGIKLGFTPKAVCITAEPLSADGRVLIEKAFGCKVYNQYSASEGGTFIAECPYGNLHVHLDSGIVEYVNSEGNPAGPGEECHLVMTSFRNFKTPLIRYQINDWVKLPTEQKVCPCGNKMPLVAEIVGRMEDYLLDEHGTEQGLVVHRTLKEANNILKLQIIQHGPLQVQMNVVRDTFYTEKDERFIMDNLRSILGNSMEVELVYCDDIPSGPNGKFKTAIRKI